MCQVTRSGSPNRKKMIKITKPNFFYFKKTIIELWDGKKTSKKKIDWCLPLLAYKTHALSYLTESTEYKKK